MRAAITYVNQYGLNPIQEGEVQKMLKKYQDEHTFKKNCKHCQERGHRGRLVRGSQRGKYIPCNCAKKKPNSRLQQMLDPTPARKPGVAYSGYAAVEKKEVS